MIDPSPDGGFVLFFFLIDIELSCNRQGSINSIVYI
nr:MAG TPA: hypothetical protein [Caudoviricetes sp.]